MDAKEAVRLAKDYVKDIFVEEQITNVGLEEIKFNDDQDCWEITVGFSRPWDYYARNLFEDVHSSFEKQRRPKTRSFKVVNIDASNAKVLSVRNHELTGIQ